MEATMPNRLVRDEMLESEAILSLPIEARWLYVTILLSADDVGLFEATSFKLARRADIRRESGDKLLQMLADADLIRLYEAEGKRYGFIPKFRQRIQIKYPKHPLPPKTLMEGDFDALNKINELGAKTTVVQPKFTVEQQEVTVGQPPEAKAKAKDIEEANASLSGSTFPPCPHERILSLWKEHLPHLAQPRTWEGSRAQSLRARWAQAAKKSVFSEGYSTAEGGIKWWKSFFEYIAEDTKLPQGFETEGRVWKPDLPWVLKADNFAKIIDGKYQK
jgi:hypothetical protein